MALIREKDSQRDGGIDKKETERKVIKKTDKREREREEMKRRGREIGAAERVQGPCHESKTTSRGSLFQDAHLLELLVLLEHGHHLLGSVVLELQRKSEKAERQEVNVRYRKRGNQREESRRTGTYKAKKEK